MVRISGLLMVAREVLWTIVWAEDGKKVSMASNQCLIKCPSRFLRPLRIASTYRHRKQALFQILPIYILIPERATLPITIMYVAMTNDGQLSDVSRRRLRTWGSCPRIGFTMY